MCTRPSACRRRRLGGAFGFRSKPVVGSDILVAVLLTPLQKVLFPLFGGVVRKTVPRFQPRSSSLKIRCPIAAKTYFLGLPLGPAKPGSFLILILASSGNSSNGLLFQGPGRSRFWGIGEFTTQFRALSGWIELDVHWGQTDLDFDPIAWFFTHGSQPQYRYGPATRNGLSFLQPTKKEGTHKK